MTPQTLRTLRTLQTPQAPRVVPVARPRGPAFWLGLVTLICGLLVAALSVPAIGASIQRGENLALYAAASAEARYAADVGAEAVTTGAHLAELSRSDADDAAMMQQTLVQGNDLVFNALKMQSNSRIDAEVDSHNRMVELANRLNRALAARGADAQLPPLLAAPVGGFD